MAWRRVLDGAVRAADALILGLAMLASLLLAGLVLLTVVDVVARNLLNAPIAAAFELTEMTLALIVFAGLPWVTRRGGHVSIDLLEPLVPPPLRRLRDVAVAVLIVVVLWHLAQQLGLRAEAAAQRGNATNILRLPLAPVFQAMGWLTLAAIPAAVLALLRPDLPEAPAADGPRDG